MNVDNMPEFLTLTDISEMLRLSWEESRRLVNRNKDKLRPFKVGREIRCASRNFKELLETLQAAN